MKMKTTLRRLALGVVVVMGAASMAPAGPMTPAGAPAPTHKTLTEVEPRIPLNPADAPADALANFRIKTPGSYYLTGDLQGFAGAGGPAGIVIECSDVTIDLGGYTLRGGFFTGDGIRVDGAFDNITIRNGVVTGWGGRGIDLWGGSFASGAVVEGVHVSANGLEGLRSGTGAVIRSSTSKANAGPGFQMYTGAIAMGCTATENGDHGFVLYGATARDCDSSQNAGAGFNGAVCVVERSAARFNDEAGIELLGYSVARENLCTQNGESIGGVGILVGGFNSSVEGNHVQFNDIGIATTPDSTQNFFSRNIAMSNGQNWNIAAGNIALVLEAALAPAIVGNSGGVSPGSTNPHANYSR
jgi:hypothetical protein